MYIEHQNSSVLVVIPTYNEKDNIALLIKELFDLYSDIDILVVDDASPDGTAKLVAQLQLMFPSKLHILQRPKKLGLGTAYIAGFYFALAKKYAHVITMDADFSHPIEKISTLLETCRHAGYDMAIGSRYLQGINVVNWPLKRILLSYGANRLAKSIMRIPIKDLTAGFQCFSRKVLKTIDLSAIKSVGYGFQLEIKFLAWKHGFKGKEVPIIFTDRIRGASKMSHNIIWEAFKTMVKLRWKYYHRLP